MNALGAHLPFRSEDEALSFLTDEQLYAELASIPEQFKELEAWREKLLGIAKGRAGIEMHRAELLSYGYRPEETSPVGTQA